MSQVEIEFVGEVFHLTENRPFYIGRVGDLIIDEANLALHRHFLRVFHSQNFWWIENVGAQIPARVSAVDGTMESVLRPGAQLPIVVPEMSVSFTAGRTPYDFAIRRVDAEFQAVSSPTRTSPPRIIRSTQNEETLQRMPLIDSHLMVLLALSEPVLANEGATIAAIATNKQAAARLGLTDKAFERRLDHACDKSAEFVRGLRNADGRPARQRREYLVQYAIDHRLVTREMLWRLDAPAVSIESPGPSTAGTPSPADTGEPQL